MQTIDPSTEVPLRTFEATTPEQTASRVHQAAERQRAWAQQTFATRSLHLERLARLLRQEREDLAHRMAEEMGKPLAEGRAEIDKCALVCTYYAETAADVLADRAVATEASRSYVTFRPLGLVLAIMPWNFPFWQVLRFAAPALAAGNGIVLKHAPNVLGCALAIEELFVRAGFPTGLVTNVFVPAEDTAERVAELLDMPAIQAVTLTGSTRAGRSLAAAAGARLKKIVLELGGSDPYVVLADAPVDRALDACVTSRLINGGQSCIAAKRLIVVDELYEAFVKGLVLRMLAVRMGDPRHPQTQIGPLAREDLRASLHRQVEESVQRGAELLVGGELPEGAGWFYPATVLGDVRPGMPAYDEELFGPVAAVIRARDTEDALRIARDTVYGLGACVFTADRDEGERIAREELACGAAFVNDFVRSDPRLPFGGTRASGYGRELGEEGLREFVNAKTVWVAP